MDNYDSKSDTLIHIFQVQELLDKVTKELENRRASHDFSKMQEPEVTIFDAFTPKLKNLTYGSPEYNECLSQMKPALEHHYSKNRHHPEFYKDGIKGMNLVDLLELLCDWKAASSRHNDGDIYKSIEINQKRFGYSDELKQILLNTLKVISKGE